MSDYVRCPCGDSVPAVEGAAVVRACPGCGRGTAVRRRTNPFVHVAVAVGVAAAVTVGFVLVVVTAVAATHRSRPVVVQQPVAEPVAPPVVVPPAVPPAAPVEPPPAPPPAVVKPAPPLVPRDGRLEATPAPVPGRFAVGDALAQDVTFTRRSVYAVAGVTIHQSAKYTLTSRLTVTENRLDGGYRVRQVVEATRLLEADESLREPLFTALKSAVGSAFEITFAKDGTVTDFTAPKDPIRVQEAAGVGGTHMRLWSVLDADGWKELAGLTFLDPGPTAKPGDTWTRPVRHDWGPLGTWSGQTTFALRSRSAGGDRIEFRHGLSYRPPQPGAGGGLAVRVVRARFEPVAAYGTLIFDAKLGRVTAAEEVFRVRGSATVEVAGQQVSVQMEEAQGFEVRVRGPAGRR